MTLLNLITSQQRQYNFFQIELKIIRSKQFYRYKVKATLQRLHGPNLEIGVTIKKDLVTIYTETKNVATQYLVCII